MNLFEAINEMPESNFPFGLILQILLDFELKKP
jgi:hypothetical protein